MLKLSTKTRGRLRKFQPPNFFWRMLGLATVQTVNGLMSTLNYRMVRYDPASDPADPSFISPAIFVLWHEYLLFSLFLRPHTDMAMVISQHQDAEILSHIAEFAGLETIRGSSNRGGVMALKAAISRGRGVSLAITPDGPRGPRRQLAQGCIYLSSRLQIPIVPIGLGFDRPWRNRRSWDQFAVPRPGSRARAIMGPRIQVPPKLDRAQLETHRLWFEQQLNALTVAAEDWAESRRTPRGAEILHRCPPMGDGRGTHRPARLKY